MHLINATAAEISKPAVAYLARLAPGSRPAMVSALRGLADRLGWGSDWEYYPWHELDRAMTSALRAWLVEKYAPATANRHLAALRGVLKEAWRAGVMAEARYHRAADLPQVKSSRLPAGREVARNTLSLVLAAAGDSRHPQRNRAIVALAFGAGLRRSELASLRVGDVDLETGEVRVRGGKGRKDRTAWVGQSGLSILREWVEVSSPDDDPAGSLFSLSAAGIYKLIRTLGRACGEEITPHDLRRTFVTRLLDNGADLAVVKELAGHSDIQTTARYDRRGERAKHAAAQLLEVPA